MGANDHFFQGNQLSYGVGGFTIIDPGQSAQGPFFCIQPINGAVIILSGISTWGGDLSGRTIKVSVFGMFENIIVSSASTYSLLAYRSQ